MNERIDALDVSVFVVPLEEPEADGTLEWDSTTVVVAEPRVGEVSGLGFTYGSAAAATLIRETLRAVVVGRDPMDVPGAWEAMVRRIRNSGRPGVCSMAIAAVDVGLWDLKAKLLGTSLVSLLGAVRDEIPVYASGGFTSLSDAALEAQLAAWVHEDGIPRVKIKIGTDRGTAPDRDLHRVVLARKSIGPDAELLVDANGAYSRKQAIRIAGALREEGVTWFEEPVSSDDLEGLAEIRAGSEVDVAAGEYAYDLPGFARLAGVVDVLQADVSRCAGVTEWLRAAALGASHCLEISGHTAQSLHAHVGCAIANLRHVEYFADHHRVDRLLFDGVLDPTGGVLRPDRAALGMGLALRGSDADKFRKG